MSMVLDRPGQLTPRHSGALIGSNMNITRRDFLKLFGLGASILSIDTNTLSLEPKRQENCDSVYLPKNLITDEGILIDGFETIDGWEINNGTIGINSNYVKGGSNSLSLTGLPNNLGRITKSNLTLDASSLLNSQLRLWLYVDDATKIAYSTTGIILGNDAGLNQEAWCFKNIHTGWNLFTLLPSHWISSGFTWTNPVVKMRLQFQDMGSSLGTIYFDDLRMGVKSQSAMILNFDDGWPSTYSVAFNYLKQFNIAGSVYVITNLINTNGNLSWDQLREMNNYGWAISNHTDDHTPLAGQSLSQQESHLNNARSTLVTHGLGENASDVAYPGGSYDSNTLLAMSNNGYLSGRTLDPAMWAFLPFDRPHQIYVSKQFGSSFSLNQALTWADNIKNNGQIGIPLIHGLVNGTPVGDTQWNINDFLAWIDHVRNNQTIFITIPQARKLMYQSISIPRNS
jgi:peptidoglycan/xylan/chitin deacetylase (PgdA/CDA1 family)